MTVRPASFLAIVLVMQDYKHLQFWQRAHALAIALHRSVRRFARSGHANLRSQLTRAADSIATNIVEGCGASTTREFARFLDISIKSANETEYHLLCARDLELLSGTDWQRYSVETVEIRKMIYVYRRKVLASNRA